ncbi:Cleavage polyadenylation factor subunit fip1 [Elasticomyces elasticus]|nr:Cleavage polyadenylation factor subunit fip1 [Elasticomyces elasticus]
MEEEEDDFYAAHANAASGHDQSAIKADKQEDVSGDTSSVKEEQMDTEDGDEDGEDASGSEDDIEIVIERKPGAPVEPPPQSKPLASVKQEQGQTNIQEKVPTLRQARAAPLKTETPAPPRASSFARKSGADYPEVHTSKVDVDGTPIWGPAGKPITELDIDADLAEHNKPWRLPGADQTDYFNYGFDEFTWASYCLKRQIMQADIAKQKAERAQIESMFGGMPGMPSAPSGPAANQNAGGMGMMSGMPGMEGIPPEMMQHMMGQMMQQGIDPSQMDFNMFQQITSGMGGMPQMGQPGAGYGQGPQQLQQNQGYGQQGYGHAMQNAQHQQQQPQNANQVQGQAFGNQQQQSQSPRPAQQQQQQNQQQMQNQNQSQFQSLTPQPGQQQQQTASPFAGYSAQQLAMLQQEQTPQAQGGGVGGGGGGGRGRGRGRRW